MDPDTEMRDAHESAYPDPEALPFDPYPTLAQSSFPIVQEGWNPFEEEGSPSHELQHESSAESELPPDFYDPASEEDIASLGGDDALVDSQDIGDAEQQNDAHQGEADEGPSRGRLIENDFLAFGASHLQEEDHSDFELDEDAELPSEDENLNFLTEDDAESSINERTRGNSRGRPRGRGRGTGRGRRGWKWALKGTQHDDLFEKPKRQIQPKGMAKRGRKKAKQRLPAPEFRTHMKKATSAFMERDLDTALESARNAVQADPEVYSGHALISDILESQGRRRDALGALLAGAHTHRDLDTWMMCADKTLELADDDPTEADLQQMLYCYMKAMAIDKQNPEVRQCRRDVFIKLKNWRSAERDCQALLKVRPNDLDDIQVFGFVATSQLYQSQPTFVRVREAYEAAFDYYARQSDHGIDSFDLWTHLNIYLEFMDKVATPIDAIKQLKRRARWILGRQEETFWDNYTADDREFDERHNTRRVYVPEFQQGMASRDLERYGQGLLLQIRMKLGIFRLKLRDMHEACQHLMLFMRYKDDRDALEGMYDWMWEIAEALRRHAFPDLAIQFYEPMQLVLENFNDQTQYWMNLAGCYRDMKRYEETEQCYKAVLEYNHTHIAALASLARLYELSGQHEAARPIVSQVIALGHSRVLDQHKVGWRPAVQRTIIARKQKAIAAKPTENSDPGNLSTERRSMPKPSTRTKPKQRRLAAASSIPKTASISRNNSTSKPGRPNQDRKAEFWRNQAYRIRQSYNMLREAWPRNTKQHDPEMTDRWLKIADGLCDEFRSMSFFYPRREKMQKFTGYTFLSKSRHADLMKEMKAMQARLQTSSEDDDVVEEADDAIPGVPQEFHGIPFTTWHRIFIECAVLHAHRTDQERCYWLLDAARWGNIFYFSKSLKNVTRAAQLHCALTFNDSETMTQICREYIQMGEGWAGAPYQFLAAFSRLAHQNRWFSASMTQKFLLRQIKQLDWPHLPTEWKSYAEHASWQQRGTMNMKVEKVVNAGFGYPELDAGVLMMYGQMIAASNHSAGTLPYYYRAFALQPENPSIVLSLGLIHIQNAMKRVSDQRQYDLAQGLSFVYRYYDLRAATGKTYHLQEAEYNLGRAWHMLSLTHLAVEKYETVLELSELVQEEIQLQAAGVGIRIEDFAQEAAIALRDILMLAGNDEAAHEITERWLVL
ncbi:TPR-like protein [Polychaeton citri CBS 116435]|uniref:TPR-like protein n=1 Tax=Polychaeton citri CBS 116435 TaxID=1314669 RepID=A0A9P4QBZ3_9PEZI|nr:TPR-like protein [Polychaeton citri CBS 116435]